MGRSNGQVQCVDPMWKGPTDRGRTVIEMGSVSLEQLQAESKALLANKAAFAPALDWVEQILPRLPSACRSTLRNGAVPALDAWLDWAGGPGFQVIEVAGKGAVLAWRRAWVLRLLEATLQLHRAPGVPEDPERARIAD